jgi:hypothetical protein
LRSKFQWEVGFANVRVALGAVSYLDEKAGAENYFGRIIGEVFTGSVSERIATVVEIYR